MSRAREWVRGSAAAAGIGAAAAGLVVVGASRRWGRATARAVEDLDGRATHPGAPVSFPDLGELPEPVLRYFRLVLRDGQPRIRLARLRQAGLFRSRESADPEAGWAPFTATQHFGAEPPGFVWDARIRMGPLTHVRVRDGYVGGRATMRGAVASLVPVVTAADDAHLRAGSLQRYLAEAVWLPTALLPGRVSWTALDVTHARATVVDGTTTAALDFEFGGDGEIVAVRAGSRLRAVPGTAGAYRPAPWGGRYGAYEVHAGMRVPTRAEVYWVSDGRKQPYYRGSNVHFEYEFAGGRDGER